MERSDLCVGCSLLRIDVLLSGVLFLLKKNHQYSGWNRWWLSRFIICCGTLFRSDFVEFNGIGFDNVNGGGV